MSSVLIVLSGATVWTMKNGTAHPTGFWAEELVAPHRKFVAAGHRVTIATPGGVPPTVDPLSLSLVYNNNDPKSVADQQDYMKSLDSQFRSALKLEDAKAEDFDVVFLVGGHGPMQDMAVNPAVGPLLAATLGNPGKIVAAVCHGPAGFLTAFNADGSWLFKGRNLTGFSNEEETAATFGGNAPWLLEDRLRLAGANYHSLPAWTPHVVVDGNLVTGQQQVSASVTADAVLKAMKVPA